MQLQMKMSFSTIGRKLILYQFIRRNILLNYHPISLLPIFVKIFEKIIPTLKSEYFIIFSQFASLVFFHVIPVLHDSMYSTRNAKVI